MKYKGIDSVKLYDTILILSNDQIRIKRKTLKMIVLLWRTPRTKNLKR